MSDTVPELRVSPDDNSIAIRSTADETAWNAWFIGNATNGGHFGSEREVAGWTPLE